MPGSNRLADAAQIAKGAYIIKDAANPDVILLANGSEVSTQMAGAQKLEEKGLKVRVVSAPSEGLFRQQPKAYQQKVLACRCSGIRTNGRFAGNLAGTWPDRMEKFSDSIISDFQLLIRCWMKNLVLPLKMW